MAVLFFAPVVVPDVVVALNTSIASITFRWVAGDYDIAIGIHAIS